MELATSLLESRSAGPHRALARAAVVSQMPRVPITMENCSAALTLCDFCRDASDTSKFPWRFVCVGSSAAKSCPRNPTVLTWDRRMAGDAIDASALGIERVVLSDQPGIATLLLNDNNISQLRLATKLDELNIARNRFASFDDIVMPFGVVTLNVSHNTLGHLTLASAMAVLTSLDATNTSLTEVDAARATELLTLLAPYNRLTTINSTAFPARLRFLDLAHNAIASWSDFAPPRALRVLNASHNGAAQFIQGNWSELASKLEVINFSSNALSSIRGVTWPTTLRELDLRDNPLDLIEIFDADLPTFQKLETFLVPDGISSASTELCAQRNATVQTVASGVSVCVVQISAGSATPTALPVAADQLDGSASQQDSSSSPSSASLLKVATVSLVSVGFIILLLVTGFVLRRRKRSASSSTNHSKKTGSHPRSLSADALSTAVVKALASLRADGALFASLISGADVEEVRLIEDSGASRTTLVRVGENVLVRKQLRVHDAVKCNNDAVLRLVREIRVTAPLEHAKIVPFRGFTCTSVRDLAIYTTYMANGNLASMFKLHSAYENHHTTFLWVATSAATSSKAVRLDFAIDIAEALVYLHSFDPPVVHGSIRAKNVLIDADWRARLTGVGQRINPDSFDHVEHGAVAWLAPEILRSREAPSDTTRDHTEGEGGEHGEYSPASDVYAFGVFLAELDSCGSEPLDPLLNGDKQRTNSELASELVDRGLRPKFHKESCPESIRSIAMACLATAREDRPTAMKVFYELSQLRKQLRQAAQTQQNTRHIAV